MLARGEGVCDAWQVHSLETMASFLGSYSVAASPEPELAHIALSAQVLKELAEIYNSHYMYDALELLLKKHDRSEDMPVVTVTDGQKQLAYCRSSMWRLERLSPGQPDLLMELQGLSIDILVKLRQLVEQSVCRFVAEMICWPNQVDPPELKKLKILFGKAFDLPMFESAVTDSGLSDPSKPISIKVHYPGVYDALKAAQPFHAMSGGSSSSPWWHTLIAIVNICKHSRLLPLRWNHGSRQLEMMVPHHGIRSVGPWSFADCYPNRPHPERLAISRRLYDHHKGIMNPENAHPDRADVRAALTAFDGTNLPHLQVHGLLFPDAPADTTAAELLAIFHRLASLHSSSATPHEWLTPIPVCGLLQQAYRGVRAIVDAIDSSTRLTEDMMLICEGGGSKGGKGGGGGSSDRIESLKDLLQREGALPWDRLNKRGESCLHVCCRLGDLEVLRELVHAGPPEVLSRALQHRDRRRGWTPANYLVEATEGGGLLLLTVCGC